MQFRLGETPFYDPKTLPKTTQDRSKTRPRWIKKAAFFVLMFDSFLGHFGCPIGLQNDSVLEPLGQDAATMRFEVILFIFRDMQFHSTTPRRLPRRPQIAPRRIQDGSKSDAFSVLIFDYFGGHFGCPFGLQNDPFYIQRCSWALLGWSWKGSLVLLRESWGALRESWVLLERFWRLMWLSMGRFGGPFGLQNDSFHFQRCSLVLLGWSWGALGPS